MGYYKYKAIFKYIAIKNKEVVMNKLFTVATLAMSFFAVLSAFASGGG